MRSLVVVLLFVVSSIYAEIAVNAPAAWATVRSNPLIVQLVGDSASIGKNKKFTLVEVAEKREKVIATKRQKISGQSFAFDFAVAPKTVGGMSYYAIKWIGDDGEEVVVAPIGFAPAQNLSQSTPLEVVSTQIKDPEKFLQEKGTQIGASRVAFSWTPDKLVIVTQGEVLVTLDPGNLKSSFSAFSQRYVSTRESSQYDFYYNTRLVGKEGISYTAVEWKGDMQVTDGAVKVIEIPWHELGIKSFSGRKLGFSLLIKGNAFPAGAKKYNPATWGDLILK